MTREELHQALQDPRSITRTELEDLVVLGERYPYCGVLHALILIALHHHGDLRYPSELQQRVLFLQSPRALYEQLQAVQEDGGGFHSSTADPKDHDPHATESSFDIIDDFLQEFPAEATEVEELIDTLHADDEAPQSETSYPHLSTEKKETESADALIAAFLAKGEEAEQITPLDAEEESPSVTEASPAGKDELFTETLARIYIRQGKYERAQSILKQINLEYPKKSGYFAQQISFLERLIRNNEG